MKVEKKEFNNSNLKFFYQRECLKKKKDKIHQIIKINGQNTHVKRKKKKRTKDAVKIDQNHFQFLLFQRARELLEGASKNYFLFTKKGEKVLTLTLSEDQCSKHRCYLCPRKSSCSFHQLPHLFKVQTLGKVLRSEEEPKQKIQDL